MCGYCDTVKENLKNSESRIRTHGGFHLKRFQGVHFKPLSHLANKSPQRTSKSSFLTLR